MSRKITKNADLKDALEGRTIVSASMDDEDGLRADGTKMPYESWNYQGGDVELVLNDGTVLTVCSTGYDAWSNMVFLSTEGQDASQAP